MSEDKVLKHLVEKLDDKVTQIQEALGSGSAKDYVEYRAMVGEVKGLLTARLNILDLRKNIEESDDE
jgi:hypothetical protein|tara:strand:- start:506 stop:706 length:201 start_codon:yes stop_codon:yes gene_type:complete